MDKSRAEFLGISQEDLEQQRLLEEQDREERSRLGDRADQTLRLLEGEDSLILEVFRQIQQELVDSILGLRPEQTVEFSRLKAQIDILYEPLNRMRLMKEMGIEARENKIGGGIL